MNGDAMSLHGAAGNSVRRVKGPVDVLAVLDDHIRVHGRNNCPQHARELVEVRNAVAELIEAAKEYRKRYGWQGSPWQERAAIKLDDALANIGSAS